MDPSQEKSLSQGGNKSSSVRISGHLHKGSRRFLEMKKSLMGNSGGSANDSLNTIDQSDKFEVQKDSTFSGSDPARLTFLNPENKLKHKQSLVVADPRIPTCFLSQTQQKRL